VSQSCLNCWRWSCLRAVSELSQSCLRAVSELSQSCLRAVLECLRAVAECLRAVPERNMECHTVSQSQDGVSRSVTMERSGVCDHRLISPTRQNPGSCRQASNSMLYHPLSQKLQATKYLSHHRCDQRITLHLVSRRQTKIASYIYSSEAS